MKTHRTHRTDKQSSACGRDIYFGANRSKSIFIVSAKDFVTRYKQDKENCCANCVKEYNRIVMANKEAKE